MYTTLVMAFAIVAVWGLSLFTGDEQQTNIGVSSASAQEPSDINNDNKVDVFDLSIVLSKWNTNDTASDLNKDGTVNVFDLSTLLGKWGTVSTPTDTNFTLIIVPDTQKETGSNPQKFYDRMNWIVANRSTLDIPFVIQVGDLVDTDNCGTGAIVYLGENNTRPQCNQALRDQKVFYPLPTRATHYQFQNADTGLRILDNANIPYGLALGNHDSAAVCGGPACVGGNADWGVPAGTTTYSLQRTTTTWNQYIPQSRIQNVQEKGFFEANKTDNYYSTFTAGGLQWMVVNLELWPRVEAINWAKSVVANHPQHNVIINTHNYLGSNGTVLGAHGGYGSTAPQYLYDNLVKVYPNIRMTFSGHNDGTASRVDTGTNGNKIYSYLDCYHDGSNNQTRIMAIDTAAGTITSSVYNNPADSATKRSDATFNYTGVTWVR